jgi:hypothetical protein
MTKNEERHDEIMRLSKGFLLLTNQALDIAQDWSCEEKNVVAKHMLAQAKEQCRALFPLIRDADDLETALGAGVCCSDPDAILRAMAYSER